jgi:guanosine-3',5'-bis(diphosphate) 3'-pyrophosphohydrolase
VTGVIGDNGGNIDNLQMVTRAQDFYDLEIVLEVHDVKHLNRIMQDLRLKTLVSSVVRMTG